MQRWAYLHECKVAEFRRERWPLTWLEQMFYDFFWGDHREWIFLFLRLMLVTLSPTTRTSVLRLAFRQKSETDRAKEAAARILIEKSNDADFRNWRMREELLEQSRNKYVRWSYFACQGSRNAANARRLDASKSLKAASLAVAKSKRSHFEAVREQKSRLDAAIRSRASEREAQIIRNRELVKLVRKSQEVTYDSERCETLSAKSAKRKSEYIDEWYGNPHPRELKSQLKVLANQQRRSVGWRNPSKWRLQHHSKIKPAWFITWFPRVDREWITTF